jgi:hypothetical protein
VATTSIKKKKKRSTTTSTSNNQNSSFFNTQSSATADWYFGNPSAVSLGQAEFQRIWGSIPLEDNWRRSNKASVINDANPAVAQADGKEKLTTMDWR